MAANFVFIIFFAFLALKVLAKNKNHSGLPFSVEIEKQQRLKLSWDYNEQEVRMEIRAKVNPKSWIAVGFSDYGEYSNGDYCVLWTDLWGRQHFTDVFSDGTAELHVDLHQDCQLVAVNQTATETVVQFTRKRTTCDQEDYQLEVTLAK